jgi:hypothetical protein
VQLVSSGLEEWQCTAAPEPELFWTVLRTIVQLVSFGAEEEMQNTPPPLLRPMFVEMEQPVIVGLELFSQHTPPPKAARFPLIEQSISLGLVEELQYTPPP